MFRYFWKYPMCLYFFPNRAPGPANRPAALRLRPGTPALTRHVPGSSPESLDCYGIGRILSVGEAGRHTLRRTTGTHKKNGGLLAFFFFFGLAFARGRRGGCAAGSNLSRQREGPLRRRRGQPLSRGLAPPPRPLSGKRRRPMEPGSGRGC